MNGNEFITESTVLNILIDVEIKEPLKFKECEIFQEDTIFFKIEKYSNSEYSNAKFDLVKCQIRNHLTREQLRC